MRAHAHLFVLIGSFLALMTTPAQGETPERKSAPASQRVEEADPEDPTTQAAREHYTRAMTAFETGRFHDAARAFEAANAALPRPVLLLNAARSWENAGDVLRALNRFDILRRDVEAPEALRARAESGYARALRALRQATHSATSDGRTEESSEDEDLISWEWVGLRLFAGIYNITAASGGWFWESDTHPMLSGELVLFTMLWDWGYWDILRIGGGAPMYITYGGSVGYRQRWGDHELRTGLHITSIIFPYPLSSGLEATYLHRFESLNFEAGARFYVFPTSLAAFVGIKF